MNQSEFLEIACNAQSAGKIARIRCDCICFACHWLKNTCETFKPVTKRSNRNRVITFNSHLKTALMPVFVSWLAKKLSRHISELIRAFTHFSRAYRRLHAFALCCDWLIGLSVFVVISQSNCFPFELKWKILLFTCVYILPTDEIRQDMEDVIARMRPWYVIL